MITDWSAYEPQFSKHEFDCRHTGENRMQKQFMDTLHAIRLEYGKAMIVTSGYRHPTHPVEARKVGSGGEHTEGMCADIACTSSRDRFELIRIAIKHGIHRIGIHPRFIHLGMSMTRDHNVIWDYR